MKSVGEEVSPCLTPNREGDHLTDDSVLYISENFIQCFNYKIRGLSGVVVRVLASNL